MKRLLEIFRTGFYCAVRSRQFYPRLICCQTDLKEAWCLWALKHKSCPICVVSPDSMHLRTDYYKNKNQKEPDRRPNFSLSREIDRFDTEQNVARKLQISDQLRKHNDHFPVHLAFSSISSRPWSTYIVDLLHQVKKGVFADLLDCLKQHAEASGYQKQLKKRMSLIPSYHGVEKFNRSWFEVSKITASNYMDMVNIYAHNNVITEIFMRILMC